jgi:hypothetical protein
MTDQPSAVPTRKITAAGLGGAVTIILVWIVHTLANVDVPPEVASSFTTLVAFALGYWVPDTD